MRSQLWALIYCSKREYNCRIFAAVNQEENDPAQENCGVHNSWRSDSCHSDSPRNSYSKSTLEPSQLGEGRKRRNNNNNG